ncbi:HD domain-containing protein [Halosolutus gelatinilyticus]|uniref:HD domain-containing protein n=1 Tax=Halosolutus gelatinilyticus TaxID=2931975 RepID=UPI001FF26247|nr:HD domain-containing protein [Halosolutus gelatinilyticus]
MLEDVRRRARTYFDDASPAHDWRHVQRVETIAEMLCDRHPEPVDDRVVTLAALLHDVGRSREDRGEIDDHAVWGAREASEILRRLGAGEGTIDAVRHCIRAHRFSNDVEPETIEAKLLSDADNLDALGAVGIARVFAYGAELGDPIHDPAIPLADDETTAGATQYNHVHKKILALPERMYTDVGRDLAADRAAFVREYVAQFDAEIAGET